jgi:seryl-tRNA synthetase
MIDPKFIRDNAEKVRKYLRDRKNSWDIDKFLALDEKRRKIIFEVEELKKAKNIASKKIGDLIKEKKDPAGAKDEVNKITAAIKDLDEKVASIEEEFRKMLDFIPNILHENVPVGTSEKDNKEVKKWGEIPKFSFKPRDHVELGEMTGILDLARAAKISGHGFPLYIGRGAKLERALINFMLDVHVNEHGYTEVFPPFIVNRESMRGTGQLPKFEEEMYRLDGEDSFLIPTAEVPLTNMLSGETIPEEALPKYYTAYTACFRREAGSYGKDTRGITRVHQFNKIELVKFVKPETSLAELEKLLADAEDILKRLELPYRVIELCTADISFAAHKCYDIELWAPGTGRWLEVSSCSVFSDFQARRANIKYQPSDRNEKARFLHTLNGSGVALARLFIALVENKQREDGSIAIPDALVPYFGASEIKNGL